MSGITVYHHKRGDTFSLQGTVELPAGTWTVTCQARKESDLSAVETLAVTLTPIADEPHAISIVGTSAQSVNWPVGETLVCDIRFADASSPPVVLHTETFHIVVVQEVTANA